MKSFTDKDVETGGQFPRISCLKTDLRYSPPKWMRTGLQQTASGYGARLNSGYEIEYAGRVYRVYVTCYSNSGSAWFMTKGKRIYVDAV